jgi:hypothetical protein
MDLPWQDRDGDQGCKGTIDGKPCDRKHKANGYCFAHNRRHDNGTNMDSPWGADSGYRLEAAGSLYLVTSEALQAHKVGISNSERRRIGEHETHGWELVQQWRWNDGSIAPAIEYLVLSAFRELGYEEAVLPEDMPQSGWTETVCMTDLTVADVVALIETTTASILDPARLP